MKPYEQTYQILSTLGRGGMGCVYLARHLRLGTLWALKEIYKSSGGPVDLLAEANMLKRLSHPALPRIIDIYEDSACIYIVEDYIEGVSLDKRIQEAGRFPESQVRAWAEELCGVLRYLHEQQPNPIIYRDMKPSNVMVTPENKVKLIDFGIAREFKQEGTSDTTSLGTMGYAAPEQYGTAQSDARTDIYSLGITLYHAVTGKSPKDPPYELRPIRQWDAELSEGLKYIIHKCTRSNPADRYQSIAELQADLKNIERFSAASRRQRAIDGLKITAYTLMIVGGVSLAMLGYQKKEIKAASAYMAQYEQGLELIETGDLDQAYTVLIGADALMPKRMDGHIAYAMALINAGEMEQCAAFAADALAQYPDLSENAQFNYCYGVALEFQGDTAGALACFRAANAAQPGQPLYMRYLARAYAAAGDMEQANAMFEEIKAMADDDSTAFVYAGILEAQGEIEQAAVEYQLCIDNSTDDSIRLAAYRELSELYQLQREKEPALVNQEIDILLSMQRAFPNEEEAFVFERLGEAYFAKGVLTGEESDFQDAINSFQSLISLGYGRASTYLNIAIIQQRLLRYADAEATLLELLDLYPRNGEACIQMAFLIAEREGKKAQNERDYEPVMDYYQLAVECGASGQNLQRLEGVISDLRSGGWIN